MYMSMCAPLSLLRGHWPSYISPHRPHAQRDTDDATAGKRKRRDEKAWSPPPEVTAESEIPATKPSPSKPNAKKQKVSQKSQREAMLKKLSGKRR